MGFWSSVGTIFGASAAATPDPTDDRYYEPVQQKSAAGIKISADSALKVAAVFRSVTILSDTIATLPLAMYKFRVDGRPDKGMDPDPNHPIADIISMAPNPRQTPADFWAMMAFHATLRGSAYAEIIPGPRGFVDRLEPIHPDRLQGPPELLSDGTLRFKILDPKTGLTRVLLQEELLRIPGLTSDGVSGLRTVELASEAIALLMAADQYAARVFSNNLNMGGFLSHPGKLSQGAADRLINKLMAKFAGAANTHRPMVLQEGMKYEKASMNAREAQLLEARKWQIGEIARYFGIPLHMLGVDDQTNRSTVEEQSLNFVRYTVKPWAEKIEQAIRRDLIIAPRRYAAVFDMDGLERGNMQARSEYMTKALGSGGSPAWLTQNEVRISEGWNPSSEKHADELAKGTNPTQNGQTTQQIAALASAISVLTEKVTMLALPPAAAAPVSLPLDPVEPDPTSDVEMRGAALLRKEVAALRRLHIKHAGDPETFRKAVAAFYGGFVSQVAEKLDVPKEAAKAWCKRRAAMVTEAADVSAVLDEFAAEEQQVNRETRAADTAQLRSEV